MAYFDLNDGDKYIAGYATGLTGDAGVVLTPGVQTTIQNTVDAYINSRFRRRFTGTVSPIIEDIAHHLTMWQIIARITPGNDPSYVDDREADWEWKNRADELIDSVLRGDMYLYNTDGTATVISTKEGKYVKHGEAEDNHIFEQDSLPHDWPERETVYDNG